MNTVLGAVLQIYWRPSLLGYRGCSLHTAALSRTQQLQHHDKTLKRLSCQDRPETI
jgi:hypothetical protein